MNRWLDTWQKRSARERWLLVLLFSVLTAALLWHGSWLPLQAATEAQLQRLHHLRLLAQRLEQQPSGGGDPATVLRQRAQAGGVPLTSLQNQQGQIKATIAAINGDVLLAWVMQLETQEGLRIVELDLRANVPPDGQVVSATLLLERR